MRSRKPKKITNRISSVTNGFVQAIIPISIPTVAETAEALAILGMTPNTMSCVYCGTSVTDWDHLQPLVRGKRPSGYLHEARNLVPSCGPCNQSKSGAHWRKWMLGKARGSPKTRGIQDLPRRIELLDSFEKWGNLSPLSFEEIIGREKWTQYWAALHEIEQKIRSAQLLADEIQSSMKQGVAGLSGGNASCR